jgi:hypothetical protein
MNRELPYGIEGEENITDSKDKKILKKKKIK